MGREEVQQQEGVLRVQSKSNSFRIPLHSVPVAGAEEQYQHPTRDLDETHKQRLGPLAWLRGSVGSTPSPRRRAVSSTKNLVTCTTTITTIKFASTTQLTWCEPGGPSETCRST